MGRNCRAARPPRPRGAGRSALVLWTLATLAATAFAQVDQQLAAAWFEEAATLCERDGGRLWGVSLCGPMAIADATTGTLATNQPAPDATRPRSLGYANTALRWGDERWSTFVWQYFPRGDDASARQDRGRLMIHELFHRVQPELGLMTPNGDNRHLETLEGRYWLQLEWRALARALDGDSEERLEALRDALAFRAARHATFPGSDENERRDEIREGLPQYTGTVVSTGSREAAVADALEQLQAAPDQPTFLRTFGYTSGAAYGVLLDAFAPGWTREVTADSDLAPLLAEAAEVEPAPDAEAAAARYGSEALRAAEERRQREHEQRVAELTARFVDGPVLRIPRATNASFVTTGSTSIPGVGTTLASYRVEAPWGDLEAEMVLLTDDGEWIVVPASKLTEGTPLRGAGWRLTLKPGWALGAGPRAGDREVLRRPE